MLLARAAADGKPISRQEWDAAEEDSGPRVGAAVGHAAVETTLALYAPHGRPRRRLDPSSQTETDMIDIEEEMRQTTEQLSREKTEPARYDFVHLGEEIADAMVKAAETQVEAAQAALEQTRDRAEKLTAAMIKVAEQQVEEAKKTLEKCRNPADGLRAQIKTVDRELADLNDRLRAFGEKILEGHRQFNNSKGD
jgi:chromosome segregation ATPase